MLKTIHDNMEPVWLKHVVYSVRSHEMGGVSAMNHNARSCIEDCCAYISYDNRLLMIRKGFLNKQW